MVFTNRQQAALKLIAELEEYRGQAPLVLAIPRGAVPMGEILVNSLGGELDVLLAKKITWEEHPELALGAVSETGLTRWEEHAFDMGLQEEELDRLKNQAIAALAEKRATYAPLVKKAEARGRNVIIVDDGVATGATMSVAIESVRVEEPARIIVATPVASDQAVSRLRALADDVVVLHVPRTFFAVSQFYEDFSQIRDDDVTRILNESRKKRPLREAQSRGRTMADQIESPP
ncbi:MAG: hypothetical protein NDI61_10245 [Bdellovibrionaceae bacterium]|nr:hypothetical protein [Pseudobdellovibrionaceae bacterium]